MSQWANIASFFILAFWSVFAGCMVGYSAAAWNLDSLAHWLVAMAATEWMRDRAVKQITESKP